MKATTIKFSLILSLLVSFVSCQEQEFYEKEFLEGVGVEKPTPNNDDGNTGDVDPNVDPDVDPDPNVDPDPDPDPGICGGGELQNASDTFNQNTGQAQKVDILWVIDNSGSMTEEQQSLASNFDTFIQDFITKEIDFKMAITTTDPRDAHNGNMVGNPDDLTSAAAKADEAKFLNDFSNYVQVGINGYGREKGFQTSASFMTKYPTFVREDALLVVVYLSDEEEQSSGSVSDYLQGFQSLKANAGMFKAFSIVMLPTDTAQNQWETVGSRYIELAEQSGGTASSIQEDFHTVLGDMGGTIVNLLTSFPLSGVPANADITVEVDGTVKEDGWHYDEVTRSIVFDNGHIPDAGSIVIVYYYQCGGS
ncbi:MAG: hypothetical protein CME70_17580 [Halobacteriovorax sp.]|nr:hypothetical protein [Halobacteriovorax sp.]|tara:strand:- start:17600 stop:18691 length:1092 start_codon:yes stop_codon:yes gene_type:complete